MVTGVVPRDLPSSVTAAPVGRDSTTMTPVVTAGFLVAAAGTFFFGGAAVATARAGAAAVRRYLLQLVAQPRQ